MTVCVLQHADYIHCIAAEVRAEIDQWTEFGSLAAGTHASLTSTVVAKVQSCTCTTLSIKPIMRHLCFYDFCMVHGYTSEHPALMLQVDTFGKSEFFGEVAIMKSSTAPTTAVASNVTATLLVISK